jgi:SOS-response transcriptional repressor LexA
MDITPIISVRRRNLARLIDDRYEGSHSNFAKAVGISLSQIGQWLSAEDSPHLRNMSERSARKIEDKAGLPTGWMDIPDGSPESETSGANRGFSLLNKATDIVTISRYDTGGSMGGGIVLRDQPGVIENWQVSKKWISENVRGYTSAANLCIVTGFGDSMRPTYNPGDPLIVDKGVTAVEFDSVYFFRIDNDGYVKRLQRIPTASGLIIKALSDNRDLYQPFDITPDMDFEVLGRVVQVWRREDY